LESPFSVVVIDRDENRINELELKDLPSSVLALAADAALPDILLLAGLTQPSCAGVIALNADDNTNLKIAISAKLLNPRCHVICRAASHDTQANMESFNTDVVINPFDSFAERLGMALHSPDSHRVYEWLTAAPGEALAKRINPPRGTWILCGYGRFGHALAKNMEAEGVSLVIIEAYPERVAAPPGAIRGRGTEAVTLQEAHIERAVGIVAGTNDDANNLSIIVTARMLKPDLFMVARQNQRENDALFDAANLDIVMQRSRAIARRIMALVRAPLLDSFLKQLRAQSNAWAADLALRLQPLLENRSPVVWTIEISAAGASAVYTALTQGSRVACAQLIGEPHRRNVKLPMVVLLVRRDAEEILLPTDDLELRTGDRLLCVGRRGVPHTLMLALHDEHVLRYLMTGDGGPSSAFWRWLTPKLKL
ncbi:MAG: NAD-binding protein, partial [Gammaproteobacteria bacterium]|nr:NAD-binding protein [Gammaproteobacteria bacterium]